MGRYQRSRALFARARRSLAGGVSSTIRGTSGPLPLYFASGQGAYVVDVDGNVLIDYVLGQGPLILGHSHPAIVRAVQETVARGQLFAAQHELEIKVAEALQRIVPCADLVRFGNSGSEMVHVALRLARAATGREKILKFEGHYHGWLDNIFLSVAPPVDCCGRREPSLPVPQTSGQPRSVLGDVIVAPWNDLPLLEAALDRYGGELAAVIMEPVMGNAGVIPPRPGYLAAVREACTARGIVLIFDEIITGFRLAFAGAQGRLGVTPDLAIFGKAMAGGFPVAAVAGRRELMELIASGQVDHSGTYNTHVVGMAAAAASLDALAADGGAVYAQMEVVGQQLITGIQAVAAERGYPLLVQGFGAFFHLAFTDQAALYDYRDCLACDRARYHTFAEALLDRDVRVVNRGAWYLSAAHSPADVARTLDAVANALDEVFGERR